MADSNIQGENSSLEAEESREFAARRTVIRGLVSAVPVILTVSSGEALANASNLQCIQHPPSLNPEECLPRGNSQNDEWFRLPKFVEDPDIPGGPTVKRNCLVYADADGNTTQEPMTGFNPFTHSCYNSFM